VITAAPSPTPLRLISTADYHRMAEVGILGADEQVELIAGQILQKMPKGPAHSALCKRLEKLLERLLADQVLVRLQDPVQLDEYSEPEPDIAVVRPRDDFYASHHPAPSDIYLLVEVADTTRDRDLGPKAQLYAAAGIPDYWVLNLSAQQLHVFREPSPDSYQRQLILRAQQSIHLHAFPTCEVSVSACFGP
jgi:Uma2 family endonuclease